MKLQLITVNYGNTSVTKNLVNSILYCSLSENIAISIIDNKSSNQSKKELLSLKNHSKLNIDISTNEKNLYYWPAIKRMLSKLNDSSNNIPDWILICNNDILFKDKLFFEKLEKIDPKKTPIIGPDIINNNGDHLNPFMDKPLTWSGHLYWWMFFLSYPTSRLFLIIRKFIHILFPKSLSIIKKPKVVYSVHASAILFSSYFFKSGGWFDGNFELYGEEMSVAEIAKAINIPITYFPNLKIFHNEHTNTKRINKKILFEKARESHRYIVSNYL